MSVMKFTDCVDLVGSSVSGFSGEKTYVSTGALDCDHIDFTQTVCVTFSDRPSRANLTVNAGDILFAKMMATKKTIRVDNTSEKYIYSTGFCAVRPKMTILNRDCLYHLLTSDLFLRQKDKNCSGATQKAITNVGLAKIMINIPNLSEQEQIAIQLDKLDVLIDKRKEQIQAFDDLIKSRFVEMFGDPETGTCIYQTERLGHLAIKISDGVHAKPEYTEAGRPFLSVVNINKGIVDFTDCKYVSEEAFQKMIKSTYPQRGDVLYTKVGATYGIPAYVDTNREFCLYVSVCLIKPNHKLINSHFLALQMGMPSIKHQADARIKGIGVPDLHLNQISELRIVCPPRELQDEFVSFVEQVDKSKLAVQQALEELETLKKSLMQQYFG